MKKSSKIILGVAIILVVILIGSIVVYYIKDREDLNNRINDLENKIVNIIETEKVVENNNANNSTTDGIIEDESDSSKNQVLSESEALKLGNEMYKKAEDCYADLWKVDWNTRYLGTDIGLNDEYIYNKINNDSITNIKNVLTDTALQAFIDSKSIISVNNNYYQPEADKGSDMSYVRTLELEVASITEEKIIFKSISEYYTDANENNMYNKVYYFTIVKKNGSWFVSEFTLPY